MIQTLVRSVTVVACIAVGAVAVKFGIEAAMNQNKDTTQPPTQQERIASEFSQEGVPPSTEKQ
ncbi:hypothetical protein [Algiphilus sp.]|uniref:hypothetical protein n=1 Tax=Algiphilus sp. TaxID=1872431 RepID=UPI001CA669F3|nr:hypothetical protein [Algiphilus sp.]MBY8965144.1 hypothetical protein [Algiphilus acroporae]MCI5063581.1 hypothetical protein [Algiphilus sp.]MCI5102718.1 hypothetical protein [Algiphilus sp.]MCR9091484.1 hypothetical protein [Pseudomonadota bacterium]